MMSWTGRFQAEAQRTGRDQAVRPSSRVAFPSRTHRALRESFRGWNVAGIRETGREIAFDRKLSAICRRFVTTMFNESIKAPTTFSSTRPSSLRRLCHSSHLEKRREIYLCVKLVVRELNKLKDKVSPTHSCCASVGDRTRMPHPWHPKCTARVRGLLCAPRQARTAASARVCRLRYGHHP